MALGISCAGTGLMEAINILETLTSDPSNFVRQGAYIAMAMIMIQHNEQTCSKVTKFRQSLETIFTSKYEDPLCRFGAILAQGIIDAGSLFYLIRKGKGEKTNAKRNQIHN